MISHIKSVQKSKNQKDLKKKNSFDFAVCIYDITHKMAAKKFKKQKRPKQKNIFDFALNCIMYCCNSVVAFLDISCLYVFPFDSKKRIFF